MAGAGIKIEYEFNDQPVIDALDHLVQASGDLETAFEDIGKYLELSHEQRFKDQVTPEGFAWYPLDPKYQARKKKNADKILVLDGLLKDLAYNASDTELGFGTIQPYGATHQFGDADRNIPTRPFLGISADDEDKILSILQNHLAAAMK